MTGGRNRNGTSTSWIKGLVVVVRRAYFDCGANGGAARFATGSDTGGSTRLDTRPTTRPVAVTPQARE